MTMPLLVILGPTSVGKTNVSVELAKRLDAEIVSADSRQVYKEMQIGTERPTENEMQGIPHHLLGMINPDQPFTLADYVELAWNAIESIHSRKKLPLLVGSAGLYIRAICEGYFLPKAPPDQQLRHELEERIRLEGTNKLFEELSKIDPEGSRVLDPNNPRRLIRFFEIYRQTSQLPSTFWKQRDPRSQKLEVMKFGLIRDRGKILERIIERVEEQERRGLLDEVKVLLKKYPSTLKAFQTHSYQEVFPYLEGKCTWEESKEMIVRHTFQYARRQWTWFKKEKGVAWEEAEPFGDWSGLASRFEATWMKSRPRP